MAAANVTKERIIYHKHHILPKHLGGSNDKSNIIKVNIPLHAFLHKLLWEEHHNIKDKVAWLALSGQITKAEAQLMLVSHPMSDETKKKLSEAKKGQPSGWKGKSPTKETREKMRQAKLNYIPWNKGKIGLQIAWNKGLKNPQIITEETRKKLSMATQKYWDKKKELQF